MAIVRVRTLTQQQQKQKNLNPGRYRIVGVMTNAETDAARRIQKLTRNALERLYAKKEKAARKIQVAANRRLLKHHQKRGAMATKIQVKGLFVGRRTVSASITSHKAKTLF